MNFDRIFNPTVQEQIEDLEYFIERMKNKYNNGSVFCKYRLHETGECNLFGKTRKEDCTKRCLLYDPDIKLYEEILKIHTDKLEKLKRAHQKMNNIHVCPVCKSDKIIIEKYFISHGMDGSYENWQISCNNCKLVKMDFAADGFYGRDYLKSKEEVIQKWNETCALYEEKEK